MLALRELDPTRLRRLACRLQPVQREQMLRTVVALAEADDEQLAGTFTRGLGAEARATLVGHLIRDEKTRAVLERRREAGAAGADASASAAARQECEVRLPALCAVDALRLLDAIGGTALADEREARGCCPMEWIARSSRCSSVRCVACTSIATATASGSRTSSRPRCRPSSCASYSASAAMAHGTFARSSVR